MRLQYVAVVEFYDEEFKDWELFEIEQQLSDKAKSLAPFNIKPEGEMKTATTDNIRFTYDEENNLIGVVMGARGSQYFIGHWLDFLHAFRAGVISRNKRHI